MQHLAFATPRKLPKAHTLSGNVVVLDIAFAGAVPENGFEKVTLRFINDLGPRLRAWVDHHDHDQHAQFREDPRFTLCTKAEHGACPEMIDEAMVERVGPVDTIVCHTDFDGLASAAKWIRGGVEPYPGCDQDAYAIDTRLAEPGPSAKRIDRALRARPRDNALFGLIVRHLANGLDDASLWETIDEAGAELFPIEKETRRAASFYTLHDGVAVVDVAKGFGRIDKTLLLLLGQEREPISVVMDERNISVAARFDSGFNFLKLFQLAGGMPTRVSLPRSREKQILAKLGVKA